MQNIAKWNAKHFLVDMFKDVLHPRIRTAYYKQLQLMHIDCNWSFDPVDFIHLKSEFGFESVFVIATTAERLLIADPLILTFVALKTSVTL